MPGGGAYHVVLFRVLNNGGTFRKVVFSTNNGLSCPRLEQTYPFNKKKVFQLVLHTPENSYNRDAPNTTEL